jgi:uroporphyrin-III C-methyltransferase/precorrin-2 dehydrogenase/sirohydrochlorin ferrochelatase/uroporphyrin-III C-methyltransferase
MAVVLPGKVFFVGAGPGDPSLLTIKAAKILQSADVVIADRLVSADIIKEYVNPLAQVISVGKQGGSSASKPQEEINLLLVKMAKRHGKVVRLKGGDVTMFSNILDELEMLCGHNIPYEIVPGITAVSGAAAYAGIPLTARNHATGVRILTYYQTTAISHEAWQELAKFEDTLVFYMSGNTLQNIVSKLLQAGAEPTMPFAVVEQATTPHQHVQMFTLEEYILKQNDTTFVSPSLVIMGRVAALHAQFGWLPNSADRSQYFKPLNSQPLAVGYEF